MWLTIAAWGFGIASLVPLVMIAGACFIAPVDWHTRLIGIAFLIAVCALLVFASGWCIRRRNERQD
jgi:membrane protein implicated in regulation of membrane protease activity